MTNENTRQTHNQLIDSLHAVEVPQNQWAQSDDNKGVLFTHGLGPCIGVTMYDPVTKKGFMAHAVQIVNPEIGKGVLSEMVSAVRTVVDDTTRLKIWVRGGQTDAAIVDRAARRDGIDFSQMGKDFLDQYIEDLVGSDKSRVDIQYDPEPMWGDSATMQRLDTTTGEFTSHAYSVSQYQSALSKLSLSNIVQMQGEQ